jgi:hypothetical protein
VSDDNGDRQLRDAAIRVLDALPGAQAAPEVLRTALVDLRQAVGAGGPPAGGDGPTLDPARDFLSMLDYSGGAARPFPLAERAAALGAQLALDERIVEDSVRITSLRGSIISSLLMELAARLYPGSAFGVGVGGRALAAVSADQSWKLDDPTVGDTQSLTDRTIPDVAPLPAADRDAAAAARHERLRSAGAAVVAVLDSDTATSDSVQTALIDLFHAVRGERPVVVGRPGWPKHDAMRHYLSRLEYSRITESAPSTLDEQAAEMATQLSAGRKVNQARPDDYNIELSEPRAIVLASLLLELAARLRPGAAFGPSRQGEALAEVATGLADELLDQTALGRSTQ